MTGDDLFCVAGGIASLALTRIPVAQLPDIDEDCGDHRFQLRLATGAAGAGVTGAFGRACWTPSTRPPSVMTIALTIASRAGRLLVANCYATRSYRCGVVPPRARARSTLPG